MQESVKRTDSIQSKRKVSSLSDRSDTSEPCIPGEASGEESPGVLSDDQPPESPSDSNDTEDTAKNMPWLKVIKIYLEKIIKKLIRPSFLDNGASIELFLLLLHPSKFLPSILL